MDDIGTDALAAATSSAIYDSSSNAMKLLPVITATVAEPINFHPAGIASNPGQFTTVGSDWSTALDSHDGDGSYVKRNAGGPGYNFLVDMDDPTVPQSATMESITIYAYARYLDGPWLGAVPTTGNIKIGYKTGSATV